MVITIYSFEFLLQSTCQCGRCEPNQKVTIW